MKYKKVDLNILNSQDLRKAENYNPIYKRLSDKSLEELNRVCMGLGIRINYGKRKRDNIYSRT